MKPAKARIAILFTFLMLVLAGCNLQEDYKRVDFQETVDSPKPRRQDGSKSTLRVAVAAMISPKETIVYYRELLQFIGGQMGVDEEAE